MTSSTSKFFINTTPYSHSVVSRSKIITPKYVGLTVLVHTGNTYLPVRIGHAMISHKFGEFAPTRKPCEYKSRKKKKKKKKKSG